MNKKWALGLESVTMVRTWDQLVLQPNYNNNDSIQAIMA
jgi:hypothetical protein